MQIRKPSELDNPQALHELLDQWLEVEFSHIDTEAVCERLFSYPENRRRLLTESIQRISATNVQLAHYFIQHIDQYVECMDEETLREWTYHAIDQYDRLGLNHAAQVIDQSETFLQRAQDRARGAMLEEYKSVLLPFLRGMSGRALEIKSGAELAFTDTDTLFLPDMIARLDNRPLNFKLLKATLTLLWAQTRYGSFNARLFGELKALNARELKWYSALETRRLMAILVRELPGIARQMREILRQSGLEEMDNIDPSLQAQLAMPEASANQSMELARKLKNRPPPATLPFEGEILPERIEEVMQARIAREKAMLRVRLSELAEEHGQDGSEKTHPERTAPVRFDLEQNGQDDLGFELSLEADSLGIPEDVQSLLSSIKLDFGEIPDEYLVAAGPGEYRLEDYQPRKLDPEDAWSGTYHEEGAFFYPEWDFMRQSNRNNWCVVRELEIMGVRNNFHRDTLYKYARLIKSIHRTFETLRGEHKTLRKQEYGEDIDLDSLVESWSDIANGQEASARLFTHVKKEERNIAVMFMVDMSGSTKGWINQAEREALILLCEALETLGDRYAIYGFSGMTRKRCEIFRIKAFDDAYDEHTIARITGIEARDYTRMGAAIRHLSMRLNEVEARIKLLVTLSDGKPEDYDAYYRTEYGIHDTRQALYEARRSGIHPFCITIDEHAAEYLPQLYGRTNYAVLNEVRDLPLKISDIYRRLTS